MEAAIQELETVTEFIADVRRELRPEQRPDLVVLKGGNDTEQGDA